MYETVTVKKERANPTFKADLVHLVSDTDDDSSTCLDTTLTY